MRHNTSIRAIMSLVSICLLAACANNQKLEDLRHSVPKGTPYQNQLAKLYLNYSEVEQKYGNYKASGFFADKGLQAAYGNDVTPESLDEWELSAEQYDSLSDKRLLLNELVTEELQARNPHASAGAMFYFDCMVSNHFKAPDGDEYRYCEEQWHAMIADLKESQKGLVASQSLEATELETVNPTDRFLVYFAFDDFSLNDAAERTVKLLYQELIKTVSKSDGVVIVVNGHTDSSGPEPYNMELSHRRAATVKKMLVALGLSPEQVSTFGFGETDLAIPTNDGVIEQQNRRVEIVMN